MNSNKICSACNVKFSTIYINQYQCDPCDKEEEIRCEIEYKEELEAKEKTITVNQIWEHSKKYGVNCFV